MQINLRSPATQKLIIITALAFGAVYGYANFMFVPRREKAKTLTADIKKENELLTKGKRVAANFQSVQDDYARLMQSWEIAHELLPTQKEMEGLLKNITLEGQERNVNFLLFRPLDPIEKPYYWENPIQIKTLSTYHDLGDFLSAVASLDRIVNINDLKLTAYKPNRGRSAQTVTAEFTASIYIFKELGTPTSDVAKPADGAEADAPAAAGQKPGAKAPPKAKTPPAAKDKEHQA
ncbi:MAG TPA: type 4a pilus biogenesis protein PilO [bacterium]|jgi:type IV pilus assembly protein PilO